jgi:hypothetical protein
MGKVGGGGPEKVKVKRMESEKVLTEIKMRVHAFFLTLLHLMCLSRIGLTLTQVYSWQQRQAPRHFYNSLVWSSPMKKT